MSEQQTVQVADGTRFAVRIGGPEDAPPLLMLSGQANSGRWWNNVRGGFENDFRTVTFDYRGTGDTGVSEADRTGWKNWSAPSFAADAAAVMEALGHARYHVYGASMGGRVAQHLAADQPERVDRLILACTMIGGKHTVKAAPEVRKLLSSPGSRERTASVIEWFFSPQWTGTLDTTTVLGDPKLTQEGLRGHRRVTKGHDSWEKLPRITAPTLVIHGAEDPMVPVENGRLLAARIPGARLIIMPQGRHGFFEEFADQLEPVLLEFLHGDDEIGAAGAEVADKT